MAAGLDLVIDVLERFAFGLEQLTYLSALGLSRMSLEWPATLRAKGEVWAVTPGTVVVPESPLLEFTAPLPIAQLLEPVLLNALQHSTLVATSAARCVIAAKGRDVIDFGLRRAPGLETGVRAAQAG